MTSEQITVGRIWGGETPLQVSLYSLGSDTCRVKVYLEEHLGARFRCRERPLYPEFVSRVRRMLRRVVERALESGRRVSAEEASQIADEEWPAELYKDHPHLALYRPRARRWTATLAQTLEDRGRSVGPAKMDQIEWADASGVTRAINLQLIGQFRDPRGDLVAVALHVGAPKQHGPHVNWSDLKDYQRLPFVLLHQRQGKVRPLVFFGNQGEMRGFRWSRREPAATMHAQEREARNSFDGLSGGTFDGTVTDWACDRCPCRTVCPWWMGALS